MNDDDSDLPRRRRAKFPVRQLMTIATLLVALFAVLAMREGCSQGVGNLFKAYEPPADSGSSAPR